MPNFFSYLVHVSTESLLRRSQLEEKTSNGLNLNLITKFVPFFQPYRTKQHKLVNTITTEAEPEVQLKMPQNSRKEFQIRNPGQKRDIPKPEDYMLLRYVL